MEIKKLSTVELEKLAEQVGFVLPEVPEDGKEVKRTGPEEKKYRAELIEAIEKGEKPVDEVLEKEELSVEVDEVKIKEEEEPKKKPKKPKKDKFQDPYADKVVKEEKKELSLSAKKWYDYFKLHFNGKDFMEELLNFKKNKSEKFKFINELNEIIEYSK